MITLNSELVTIMVDKKINIFVQSIGHQKKIYNGGDNFKYKSSEVCRRFKFLKASTQPTLSFSFQKCAGLYIFVSKPYLSNLTLLDFNTLTTKYWSLSPQLRGIGRCYTSR